MSYGGIIYFLKLTAKFLAIKKPGVLPGPQDADFAASQYASLINAPLNVLALGVALLIIFPRTVSLGMIRWTLQK
jgi:hypothetical protein